MNRVVCILFTVLAVFSGCREDGTPVAVPSGPVQLAFVIDSLSVQAVAQLNGLQIPVMAVYHFEGQPGSLMRIRLDIDTLGYEVLMTPSLPTPTGSRVTSW